MKNQNRSSLCWRGDSQKGTGCGSTKEQLRPDRGQRAEIISGQINIQDYANAANDAVNDLLVIRRAGSASPKPPAVLHVSRIINNTGQQVDTDLITHKITLALLQSGKAVTTTTDPTTQNLVAKNNPAAPGPDFTLSGKIIETIDRAGNMSQPHCSISPAFAERLPGPGYQDLAARKRKKSGNK